MMTVSFTVFGETADELEASAIEALREFDPKREWVFDFTVTASMVDLAMGRPLLWSGSVEAREWTS